MIGVIGDQDDIIGFGLTGIEHLIELPPNATKQDVQQAQAQFEKAGVSVIITPGKYKEHLETDIMIIEIPQQQNNTLEEIEALAKELLGVQL